MDKNEKQFLTFTSSSFAYDKTPNSSLIRLINELKRRNASSIYYGLCDVSHIKEGSEINMGFSNGNFTATCDGVELNVEKKKFKAKSFEGDNVPVIGKPFVEHVNQQKRPEISNPIEFLKKAYETNYTGNDNLIRYGQYKLMGYKYDFTHMLNQYVYKQYGDWREAWAPNKTTLRKVVYGKIDKIVEL
tara:strand:+ start:64715 stop:65278 length:564 start_codon:yes stop_codon:yes gene_type:complete